MWQRTLLAVSLTLTLSVASLAEPIVAADDLAWSLTIHPKAMAQSELGRAWSQQIGSMHDEWTEQYRLLTESLGIDLWESSDTVLLFNRDFEIGAFLGVASLGPSAGNIEGALLSVPGYESEMLDDETILNITPWDERGRSTDRLYSAVVRLDAGQQNYFVAGLDRDGVEDLVDRLRAGRSNLDLSESDAGALMAVHAYRAAPRNQLSGPHAGVVSLLTGLDMRLAETDGRVDLSMRAQVDEPARARQLQQMVSGWATFLTMAAGFNDRAEPTHAVMEQIKISSEGDRVEMNLSCDAAAVVDAMRNLAVDKPFDAYED